MGQVAVIALQDELVFDDALPWLDAPQLQRLDAITHPARKQQFLAARSIAIDLLQRQSVTPFLSSQASGRPQAIHWPSRDGLSWSHTPHWAGAALGFGRVGLDVETIRARRNILSIAEQYFSPAETDFLKGLAAQEQLRTFYLLWVAKEALLKALGTGIAGGLARFELLKVDGDWQLKTTDTCIWYLQIWQLDADCFCAVASDTPQNWQFGGGEGEIIMQICTMASI